LGVSTLFAMVWHFNTVRSIYYLHRTKSLLGSFLTKLLKGMGWSFQPLYYPLSESNGISSSLYEEANQILISERKEYEELLLSHFTNTLGDISHYERMRLATCFSRYAVAHIYFPVQLYVILSHKFPSKNRIKAVLLKKGLFSDSLKKIYGNHPSHPLRQDPSPSAQDDKEPSAQDDNERFPLFFYYSFYPERIKKRKHYLWDREIPYYQRDKEMLLLLFRSGELCLYLIFSFLLKMISTLGFPKVKLEKYGICSWIFNHRATDTNNCLPWAFRKNDPLKKEMVALHPALPEAARNFYENRAARLVEIANHHFFMKMGGPYFLQSQLHFPGLLFKNLWLYRKLFGLGGIDFWISQYLTHFLMKLSFFEAFFLTAGTKILWTMNEDDSETQIAAIAIRRVGGVSLGTSWSQPFLPSWDLKRNQNDIFFSWGERMVEISTSTGVQCHSYVIAGYPAEEAIALEFKKAKELKAALLKSRCYKKIVVFFDNIAANDVLISEETLLETYDGLFSWLESHPDNFLIIKSKRSPDIDDYPRIKEKIEPFHRQKKLLFICDKGALYPGLAGDLVFSLGSISLSSLSALLGKPLILYDKSHHLERYPLILPNLTLVHESHKICETIQTTLENNRLSESLIDLKPLRRSPIDPFMDGKSASRVHHYIQDLLGALNEGDPPSQAIAVANNLYKKRWGGEMVISGPLKRCDDRS
ncbi:MAG: hypothetical protein AAB309_04070, partial [Deltaproteobacteria bacterium]